MAQYPHQQAAAPPRTYIWSNWSKQQWALAYVLTGIVIGMGVGIGLGFGLVLVGVFAGPAAAAIIPLAIAGGIVAALLGPLLLAGVVWLSLQILKGLKWFFGKVFAGVTENFENMEKHGRFRQWESLVAIMGFLLLALAFAIPFIWPALFGAAAVAPLALIATVFALGAVLMLRATFLAFRGGNSSTEAAIFQLLAIGGIAAIGMFLFVSAIPLGFILLAFFGPVAFYGMLSLVKQGVLNNLRALATFLGVGLLLAAVITAAVLGQGFIAVPILFGIGLLFLVGAILSLLSKDFQEKMSPKIGSTGLDMLFLLGIGVGLGATLALFVGSLPVLWGIVGLLGPVALYGLFLIAKKASNANFLGADRNLAIALVVVGLMLAAVSIPLMFAFPWTLPFVAPFAAVGGLLLLGAFIPSARKFLQKNSIYLFTLAALVSVGIALFLIPQVWMLAAICAPLIGLFGIVFIAMRAAKPGKETPNGIRAMALILGLFMAVLIAPLVAFAYASSGIAVGWFIFMGAGIFLAPLALYSLYNYAQKNKWKERFVAYIKVKVDALQRNLVYIAGAVVSIGLLAMVLALPGAIAAAGLGTAAGITLAFLPLLPLLVLGIGYLIRKRAKDKDGNLLALSKKEKALLVALVAVSVGIVAFLLGGWMIGLIVGGGMLFMGAMVAVRDTVSKYPFITAIILGGLTAAITLLIGPALLPMIAIMTLGVVIPLLIALSLKSNFKFVKDYPLVITILIGLVAAAFVILFPPAGLIVGLGMASIPFIASVAAAFAIPAIFGALVQAYLAVDEPGAAPAAAEVVAEEVLADGAEGPEAERALVADNQAAAAPVPPLANAQPAAPPIIPPPPDAAAAVAAANVMPAPAPAAQPLQPPPVIAQPLQGQQPQQPVAGVVAANVGPVPAPAPAAQPLQAPPAAQPLPPPAQPLPQPQPQPHLQPQQQAQLLQGRQQTPHLQNQLQQPHVQSHPYPNQNLAGYSAQGRGAPQFHSQQNHPGPYLMPTVFVDNISAQQAADVAGSAVALRQPAPAAPSPLT